MIDVGANIGTVTLEASVMVGEFGRVFAVEAHPVTFKYLQGNLRLNGVNNVSAYNVALGDTSGTVFFSDEAADDQNSIIINGDGVEIPICPLDDLPIDERVIALLKIDVEGYERFVLRGAKRTLEVTECIYFESWDQHFRKYGYTSNDLCEFLRKCGFQLFKILHNTAISRIPPGYASENKEDLLGVRDPERFLQRTSFQLAEQPGTVKECFFEQCCSIHSSQAKIR